MDSLANTRNCTFCLQTEQAIDGKASEKRNLFQWCQNSSRWVRCLPPYLLARHLILNEL